MNTIFEARIEGHLTTCDSTPSKEAPGIPRLTASFPNKSFGHNAAQESPKMSTGPESASARLDFSKLMTCAEKRIKRRAASSGFRVKRKGRLPLATETEDTRCRVSPSDGLDRPISGRRTDAASPHLLTFSHRLGLYPPLLRSKSGDSGARLGENVRGPAHEIEEDSLTVPGTQRTRKGDFPRQTATRPRPKAGNSIRERLRFSCKGLSRWRRF